MTKYDPSTIEPKWQRIWEKSGIYEPDLKGVSKPFGKTQGKPFYNLMMFPYPSAEGLHVGNMYAFTGADIYGRFKRMQGFDVFEPIGLDGFGIHSENYALKVGRHPMELAKETEKNFYRQLRATGNGYAWKEKLETYDPDYYKWTQWIFVQMFKRGLAYRGKAPVNWCPSCKTVLADEQVINGACERCKTIVEKRQMEQWFFKITKYAERLLNNLEKINWSEKVKIAQRNWIGKSDGWIEKWKVDETNIELETFTTWPHTTYGATFIVIAPEHPVINELVEGTEYAAGAKKFIQEVIEDKAKDPAVLDKEKKGYFLGRYAINHLTGKKMPIHIANFAIMEYGTGIVKGAPAHDQRDFEFAKKYKLPIIMVIRPKGSKLEAEDLKEAYVGPGIMTEHTEQFTGMSDDKARTAVADYSIKLGHARKMVLYHLRDWLISRQRYWGPPIPMINCPKCGWQSVPEKDLPVLLPEVEDWRPKGTGKSPLANIGSFVKTTCPKCKGPAERETDVSDTFLDSSWYFFRYPSVDTGNKKMIVDPLITKKWLPVDMYIGGAEHAVLHLLYSRFITMVFHDLGLIDFSAKGGLADEPYKRFYAHGLLISEGAKISKSRGNLISPDNYISRYGSDTLRCYLMFLGPFDQGGDFRDASILGIWRFLNRVWKLVAENKNEKIKMENDNVKSKNLERVKNQTIKKVTGDIENLRYNTALASLMEYYNEIAKLKSQSSKVELRENIKTLLLLLAPFAPHMAEELWQRIESGTKKTQSEISTPVSRGQKSGKNKKNHDSLFILHNSIHTRPWPKYNENSIKEETVTVVVCVNGKMRDKLVAPRSQSGQERELVKLASASSKIQKYLAGKKIKKTVFVPERLINFVI
ncbi:MAG: leucine--tRNA ligase [bacterium]|nr:leucine--tRNA ligase [bacterium]